MNGFLLGGAFNPASCGTSPFLSFWQVKKGDPTFGQGVDSGASTLLFFDANPPYGYDFTSDWGNAFVDGCILDPANLQGDGTFGPMAVIISNGLGEGTASHAGTYSVVSVDFDDTFQAYNLDQANPTASVLSCAGVPTPTIGTSSGTGPFSVSLS